MICIGVTGLLLNSCYYDDVPPTPEIPDGTVVTYKADIAPLLSGCTTCHNGTQSPDLRNTQQAYNALFPSYVVLGNAPSSKLYYFAPGNTTSGHPSVGVSLTDANFTTMKYWIDNEALYE